MQKKIISDIFASRQSNKILTGIITSIEPVKMNGEIQRSVIIIYEDYKIVLPVENLGVRDDLKVLRSLIGAEINFIITGISEAQKIAIGSRVKAMELLRTQNANRDLTGKIITAKITGVGKELLYVEAFGVETTIAKKDIDYGYISDLRKYGQIGEKIKCKVKESDIGNNILILSIKELQKNPYENLEDKFPLHSEHLATITNIQPYGIFLIFDQYPKITVLCPIPKWNNFSPAINDKYVVKIKRINNNKISGTLIRFVKRAAE